MIKRSSKRQKESLKEYKMAKKALVATFIERKEMRFAMQM